MTKSRRLTLVGIALGLLLMSLTAGNAATQVQLNGNPVAFDVAPFQVADRTMVPMRAIFEALGARVQWNEATQTVTATKAATDVQLTIGETVALVNGQNVTLDVPALVRRGSTMVPLRFVSEALGADVNWSEARQMVSITTGGATTPVVYTDPGQTQTQTWGSMTIPQGTVIPVTLDGTLNSLNNRVGDTFRVTVRSTQNGDAEFPLGTKITGSVVGVQQATTTEPGTMDLRFREAQLPDGTRISLDGSVISLDDKAVTKNADGRLVATVKPTKDNQLTMIGIGVGAGLLIGKLLDQNLLIGGLLGGAAGYFYNEYTKDKVKPTDVNVKTGTIFGVRMDSDVTYNAPQAFLSARNSYRNTH